MARARYTVEAEHESGETRVAHGTNDLADAVEAVLAFREDGDGSETFRLRDTRSGRLVTRGDVRRAGVRA